MIGTFAMFCFSSPQSYSTRDMQNGDYLSVDNLSCRIIFLMELQVIIVITGQSGINYLVWKNTPFQRKKYIWDNNKINFMLEFKFILQQKS